MMIILLVLTATTLSASTLTRATEEYNAGNTAIAIGLFRQAAREGESPSLCYFNMANGYFQLDSLAKAVVYYRACIRSAPDFFKAHLNLAVCYYSLNDLGRSIAAIRTALKLEPRHEKSLLIQAAALRRCGAIPAAVAAFENITKLYPRLEDPWIALGELYRELGDHEDAIARLSSCPSGEKNAPYVNSLLADMYEKNSDLPRAIYYLNQSFEADTTKRWTLYRIASLQLASKNDLVALETIREALVRFPDFADLAVLGGTIAFDRGNLNLAETLFRQGADAGSPAAVVGLSNIRNRRKASQPE